MGHISITQHIAVPPEQAFAYVDDHTHTTAYMKALDRWEPAGRKVHGKGARFAVAMKAGPMTLSSVVEISQWTENRVIAWRSTEGFRQTGRWSFRNGGDGTDATFDLEYELPGGIAGRVLARAADPIIRANLEASVRQLRTLLEKHSRRTTRSAPRAATQTAAKAASTGAAASRARAGAPPKTVRNKRSSAPEKHNNPGHPRGG